ncbi:MAG: Sec-independent protein translocase protein TatC [Chloroflexi bacterium ADurb.Bin360]|nr:MAG: Sec-independent protein translocase protein TatC [Chloroflexi bacterium ADurb.Bin360]
MSDEAKQDRERPLLEHITELRLRLLRIVVALIIGATISSFFTPRALEILTDPVGDIELLAISPTAPPIIFFKVALLLGLVLTLPYILYQIYAFIAPGLFTHERRFLLLSVPGVIVLFAAGIAFTLLVLVPFSIPVLQGFLPNIVTHTYTLQDYLSFVTTLLLWMGLLFQTPLVMYTLARLNVIQPANLKRLRKLIIFLAAVMAAIITPTTDPFTMLLVTGPFIVLYELGILLASLALRQRHKRTTDAPS